MVHSFVLLSSECSVVSMYHRLLDLPVEGHLDHFQLWTITKQTAFDLADGSVC